MDAVTTPMTNTSTTITPTIEFAEPVKMESHVGLSSTEALQSSSEIASDQTGGGMDLRTDGAIDRSYSEITADQYVSSMMQQPKASEYTSQWVHPYHGENTGITSAFSYYPPSETAGNAPNSSESYPNNYGAPPTEGYSATQDFTGTSGKTNEEGGMYNYMGNTYCNQGNAYASTGDTYAVLGNVLSNQNDGYGNHVNGYGGNHGNGYGIQGNSYRICENGYSNQEGLYGNDQSSLYGARQHGMSEGGQPVGYSQTFPSYGAYQSSYIDQAGYGLQAPSSYGVQAPSSWVQAPSSCGAQAQISYGAQVNSETSGGNTEESKGRKKRATATGRKVKAEVADAVALNEDGNRKKKAASESSRKSTRRVADAGDLVIDEDERRKRRRPQNRLDQSLSPQSMSKVRALRERNRLAAAKCRNKMSSTEAELNEKADKLQLTDEAMKKKVAAMTKEKERLDSLMVHHNCVQRMG